MRRIGIVLLVVGACHAPSTDVGDTDGDADTDVAEVVPPDAQPLKLFLHGGSYADRRSSTRFVNAAHGGLVVTLGAVDPSDPDLGEYDPWWTRLGASDARTLNLRTRDEANAPEVAEALAQADAIYLRGGDLSELVSIWSGTAVTEGLTAAVARGAPVGGTAAGAAFLGAWVSSGGALESWDALTDDALRTSAGPVGLVGDAVIDTDLAYRARLGRLVASTRAALGVDPAAQGVGLDGQTALMVWADGTAEVAGQGAITVLRADPTRDGALRLWHLTSGYTVDLSRPDPVVSRPDAVPAIVTPDPLLPWARTTLYGADDEAGRAGAWALSGVRDADGWWDGALSVVAGSARLTSMSVVPSLFGDALTAGTRQQALLTGVAAHPEAVGLGLDVGAKVEVLGQTITPLTATPVWVLDARGASFAGVQDTGWHNPVIEGASLWVSTAPWTTDETFP